MEDGLSGSPRVLGGHDRDLLLHSLLAWPTVSHLRNKVCEALLACRYPVVHAQPNWKLMSFPRGVNTLARVFAHIASP